MIVTKFKVHYPGVCKYQQPISNLLMKQDNLYQNLIVNTHTPVIKWAKDTKRTFISEDLQTTNIYVKKCSILLAIKKMKQGHQEVSLYT